MPASRHPRFDSRDDLLDAPVAHEIDLHGRTADEAGQATRAYLATQARVRSGKVVRIITGRGRNSRGGASVLRTLVRRILQQLSGSTVAEYGLDDSEGSFLVRLR